MIERLENPVFRQSSRQRMRGARTYGCLMAYLIALGLVVLVSYDQFLAHGVRRAASGLAQTLFDTLVATQWFLVAFITPALTTSAITMEREQRTFDLLLMTPLSRFAIVWGKFASALAFILVMIVCGIPLVAVLFLMGGVDTGLLLERYTGMLGTGALLAAFGLMMSAICSNTTLANVLTYGALAGVYFAGIVAGLTIVMSRAFGGAPVSSLWASIVGLPVWQIWLFAAVNFCLTVLILLQVATNYLLPDPREGAWKTRLLTATLYLWSLGAEVIVIRAASVPSAPSNPMVISVAIALATIAPIVSTGVPQTGRGWLQWLHPRSLKVGTVQSAWLYLLLLLLAGVIADRFIPAGMRSVSEAWLYVAGYVWWMWALGYLASVLVGNRWGALFLVGGITYLFLQVFYTLVQVLDVRVWLSFFNLSLPVELFRDDALFVSWSAAYFALGAVAALAGWRLAIRKAQRAQARG